MPPRVPGGAAAHFRSVPGRGFRPNGWARLAAWLCLLSLAVAGCIPRPGAGAAAASTPTGEPAPTLTAPAEATEAASPTLAATATTTPPPSQTPLPASATPEASPTPEPLVCHPELLPGTQSEICYLDGPLSLERPIGPDGRNTVDVAYRYGSTQDGTRDPHNGVEFLNSYGTPVLAAADGVVVLAENDYNQVLGLYFNFYGNLVVIEHRLAGHTRPVYTLYGHLAEYQVQAGQEVKAGEQIGLVGMGGAATGSHLHFEVRYGENQYRASRNPELWLKPLLDEDGRPMGAFAARILDEDGNSLESENIVLERLSADGYTVLTRYTFTYHEKWMRDQAPWEDSFGIGDLPAGIYRVSFVQRGMQQYEIEIRPGQLALVTFRV